MKKALKPTARRTLVNYLKDRFAVSPRLACRMVGISDSVYRYEPDLNRDDAVIEAIQAVVERYPAYGFPKVCKILKR